MNNEPVAYLMVERNDGNSYIQMGVPTRDEKISHQPYPLYIHPVKEQDTDCQYCKQGCIRCDARKQLTDEEIYACFHQYFVLGEPKPTHYELEYEDLIDFARALLRKASEKC